jgi:hypothetical protein
MRLRWLQRWQIGTSYVTVAKEAIEIMQQVWALHEQETEERAAPLAVVDYTGVGRGVVDMIMALRPPMAVVAVTITGSDAARHDTQHENWAEWSVPKKDLVAPLLVAAQNQLFSVAAELPLADLFGREMQAFRMKTTRTGGVSYEHEKSTDHDDLIICASLAAWQIDKINRAIWQ